MSLPDQYTIRCIGSYNESIPRIDAQLNQTYTWEIPGQAPFFIGRSIRSFTAGSQYADTYCSNPVNSSTNTFEFTLETFQWNTTDSSKPPSFPLLRKGDSVLYTAVSMANGPVEKYEWVVSPNYTIGTNAAVSTKTKSMLGMALCAVLVSLVSAS